MLKNKPDLQATLDLLTESRTILLKAAETYEQVQEEYAVFKTTCHPSQWQEHAQHNLIITRARSAYHRAKRTYDYAIEVHRIGLQTELLSAISAWGKAN